MRRRRSGTIASLSELSPEERLTLGVTDEEIKAEAAAASGQASASWSEFAFTLEPRRTVGASLPVIAETDVETSEEEETEDNKREEAWPTASPKHPQPEAAPTPNHTRT